MNTEIEFEIACEKIKSEIMERLVFIGEHVQDTPYNRMSKDMICNFIRSIDNMMTYCEENNDKVPMQKVFDSIRTVYLNLDNKKVGDNE